MFTIIQKNVFRNTEDDLLATDREQNNQSLHSFRSLSYKGPKLFQSEFSIQRDLVQSSVNFQHSHIFSLSSSSCLRILSRVPVTSIQCHPVAAYVFFLVFPSLPFDVIPVAAYVFFLVFPSLPFNVFQ
jgi:hypothetical protein